MEDPGDYPDARRRELRAGQLRRRQKEARRVAWDCSDDQASSPNEGGPKETRRPSEPDLHKRRRIELDKLDALERVLFRDLSRIRPVVLRGKVVVDPFTGEPLIERAADLVVVDRLLRIADRRAKVRGIDAPRRREALVVTEDMLCDEIARIEAEIVRLEAQVDEELDT